ncbi:hypothetical protein HNY73_023249 [Argiope bruennichi]|uniref:Uncharacterized protein n=1 Tax=Argiope bruennichi TaxID=94029 RepID=A0A8T0E377_ARGBR|nr:hypothetical protein HNY73_023249 [Argiope bruennichi]
MQVPLPPSFASAPQHAAIRASSAGCAISPAFFKSSSTASANLSSGGRPKKPARVCPIRCTELFHHHHHIRLRKSSRKPVREAALFLARKCLFIRTGPPCFPLQTSSSFYQFPSLRPIPSQLSATLLSILASTLLTFGFWQRSRPGAAFISSCSSGGGLSQSRTTLMSFPMQIGQFFAGQGVLNAAPKQVPLPLLFSRALSHPQHLFASSAAAPKSIPESSSGPRHFSRAASPEASQSVPDQGHRALPPPPPHRLRSQTQPNPQAALPRKHALHRTSILASLAAQVLFQSFSSANSSQSRKVSYQLGSVEHSGIGNAPPRAALSQASLVGSLPPPCPCSHIRSTVDPLRAHQNPRSTAPRHQSSGRRGQPSAARSGARALPPPPPHPPRSQAAAIRSSLPRKQGLSFAKHPCFPADSSSFSCLLGQSLSALGQRCFQLGFT